jgi:hypothetical protein
MARQIDKSTFLEGLRVERARWEATLDEVGEGRMEEPGAEGSWNVKDVIAHISWHEREMIEMLRRRSLEASSDLWVRPLHERNASNFEQNRDRSLREVFAETRETFPQLVREAEALSDEELNDPGRFAGMPEDWVPWKLIAENSYEHYRDHDASLRSWLGQRGK